MRLDGFARPPDPVGPDFAGSIATRTGRVISDAGVNPTEAWVDGEVNESDRYALQMAVNAYALDPTAVQQVLDAARTPEQIALRVRQALLNWADTMDTAYDSWPTMTDAQRLAAMRACVNWTGKLCRVTAHLLRYMGVD